MWGNGRAVAALTASVLAVAALGGCGSTGPDPQAPATGGATAPSTTPAPTASGRAAADLTFALSMVPHHLQAVELADLVPARSDDASLRALAQRVRQASQGEVDQLTGLLAAWGASPDALSDGAHQGGAAANGMADDAQLLALGAMSGERFRAEWLRLMIAHHEGAIAMARAELASGTDPQARALATSMLGTRAAELDQMRRLLGG